MNCQNCKNCNCNCNIRGNEEEEGEREQKKRVRPVLSQFHILIPKFTYTYTKQFETSEHMVFPFPFFLFVLFIPFIHSVFCTFFLGYSNLKLGMKWRGNGTYGSLGLAITLA